MCVHTQWNITQTFKKRNLAICDNMDGSREYCCLDAKLSLTLLRPMDCSPPGSSPWDFSGKNTGVCCHFLLQGIFLTRELNSCLLHCRWILNH